MEVEKVLSVYISLTDHFLYPFFFPTSFFPHIYIGLEDNVEKGEVEKTVYSLNLYYLRLSSLVVSISS